MAKIIEENVLVFPNQLHFQEDRNHQFNNDYIIISSAWLHGIAFQILPSMSRVFEVSTYEGFVPPCESRRIPIIFNSKQGNRRNLTASFTVNIAEASDRDLIDNDPELFWRLNPKFFSKTLPCEVNLRETMPPSNSDTDIDHIESLALPRGHILDLMIKNVSKDSPLSAEEAEELKSIRSVMTRDHWNHWLKFARDEKKKRNPSNSFAISTRPPPPSLAAASAPRPVLTSAPPAYAATPSPLLNSLGREDSQIIDATHAAVQTAYEYQTKSQQRERYPTPQSFEMAPSPSPALAIPDIGSNRPRGHAKSSTPANSPPQPQPAVPTTFSSSFSVAPAIPPFQLSSSSSSALSSTQAPSVSMRSRPKTVVLGESVMPKRSAIPSPPSFTHPAVNDPSRSTPSSPQSYAHVAPVPPHRSPPNHHYQQHQYQHQQQASPPSPPPQQQQRIKSATTSASIRITHRMSAPAERMSQPGNHLLATGITAHPHEHKPRPSSSPWHADRRSQPHQQSQPTRFDLLPDDADLVPLRASSPLPHRHSTHQNQISYSPSSFASAFASSNVTSSVDRLSSSSSQLHPSQRTLSSPSPTLALPASPNAPSTSLSSHSHALPFASRDGPGGRGGGRGMDQVSNNGGDNDNAHGTGTEEEARDREGVSQQSVPDVVKSSTLRIDSAFAAAQSLKASLEADLESGSTNSEKASSTLAMVNAMLASLEKSKTSLKTLSQETNSLHFNNNSQQQQQQPQQGKQRQGQGQNSGDQSQSQLKTSFSFDPTKLQRYQSILSRVEDDFGSQREGGGGGEGEEEEDDQRFDPPENEDDYELPFSSTGGTEEIHSIANSSRGNGHRYPQQQQPPQRRKNSSSAGKWRGESIGIDQRMKQQQEPVEEEEEQEQEQEEDDMQSEVSSAMEASDWPPPGRLSKGPAVVPPKRGFISAEERLRPSVPSPSPVISQRSLSTSRMDSRDQRGHRGSANNSSTITNFSQSMSYPYEETEERDRDLDPHSRSHSSSTSGSKKPPNAPHYFLKSRHGTSSPAPSSSASASAVSRKSIHTVRYAKGMPRVVRLCISHGPTIKSVDDNPLRIDLENRSLDVVWRERHIYGPTKRAPHNGHSHSNGNGSASTLRRERYSFDDVYTGAEAPQRMSSYTKRRVKTSLLGSRGIVFLCLAGGDFGVNSTVAYLEPPMALILGDSGGQGLIASALDEIFKCKAKYLGGVGPQPIPHKLYSGSVTPIRSHSQSRSQSSGRGTGAGAAGGGGYLSNDYVLFSAVMVCEGQVMDLLGPSSSPHGSSLARPAGTRTRISQRSDGCYAIHHATRLQLRSVSDFERIAGVLLGRRAALREVTSLLFSASGAGSVSPAELLSTHQDTISVADMPWLLASENEACILFTLTTTGEGVSMSSHGAVNYYFTCPCGKYWSLPGSEICLLAEAISGLPHIPPPSLYQAGEITKLLVDPQAPDMDYITVASVGNQRREVTGKKVSLEEDEEMIQNALQSFRVVSQLSAIS